MPIYFARFFRPAYFHSANRMQSEVTNFMDTIYERTIFTKWRSSADVTNFVLCK